MSEDREAAAMSSVERLEQALRKLRRQGYEVRQEWLGGQGSAACVLRGRKLLFLDLAQSTDEQIDAVEEALREKADVTRQAA